MNQSLLQADIILRDRARERDRLVAEGRVLRALDAAASGPAAGRQASSMKGGEAPSRLRALIGHLWRELRLPSQPERQRPLCVDSSL